MVLVALFSRTLENAYAYVEMLMFILVSVVSFLWIKSCCKMARYSTLTSLDLGLFVLLFNNKVGNGLYDPNPFKKFQAH